MCNVDYTNGFMKSKSTFSEENGSFSWASSDMSSFPPGEYKFRITGTVGSSSHSVEFTLKLESPCETASLMIMMNPFEMSSTYVLRDMATSVMLDAGMAGMTTSPVSCGMPTLKVISASGSSILDSIFKVDGFGGMFTVGPSSDYNKAGEYQLKLKYYFSDAPSNSIEQPFTFTVIDRCAPPAGFAAV